MISKLVNYDGTIRILKPDSNMLPEVSGFPKVAILFIFGTGADFDNNFGSGSGSSYSYSHSHVLELYFTNRDRN